MKFKSKDPLTNALIINTINAIVLVSIMSSSWKAFMYSEVTGTVTSVMGFITITGAMLVTSDPVNKFILGATLNTMRIVYWIQAMMYLIMNVLTMLYYSPNMALICMAIDMGFVYPLSRRIFRARINRLLSGDDLTKISQRIDQWDVRASFIGASIALIISHLNYSLWYSVVLLFIAAVVDITIDRKILKALGDKD